MSTAFICTRMPSCSKGGKNPSAVRFTSAHELGHYLLDREEVEEVDLAVLLAPEAPISAVETCATPLPTTCC